MWFAASAKILWDFCVVCLVRPNTNGQKNNMNFSILHISDLHRDLDDEIGNDWLLDSLENDFNQFSKQTHQIMKPSICIVSGDLVHGVGLGVEDADSELKRQYSQVETFLIGLADRFFNGEGVPTLTRRKYTLRDFTLLQTSMVTVFDV